MTVLASVGSALLDALSLAFGMTWEILWALILGFALPATVQAVVSRKEMTRSCPTTLLGQLPWRPGYAQLLYEIQ